MKALPSSAECQARFHWLALDKKDIEAYLRDIKGSLKALDKLRGHPESDRIAANV